MLETIVLPDSVTEIRDDAFWYCSNLDNIIIPSNVTVIGQSAFEYCQSFTEIVIPESVNEIQAYAFKGCTNLQAFHLIKAEAPFPRGADSMFLDCNNYMIYVPFDSLDNYQLDPFWSIYYDRLDAYLRVTYYEGSLATGFIETGMININPSDYPGSLITLEDLYKLGYTTDSCFSDPEKTASFDFDTAILTDTILYCDFTPNTYTISFNSDGGSPVEPYTLDDIQLTYDVAIPVDTLPTVTKTGYNFIGWYYGTKLYEAGVYYQTAANITLMAQWQKKSYTVNFEKLGGINGSDSVTVFYDSAMPSAVAPTKTGYTFGGYYLEETFITQYYTATALMTSVRNWTIDSDNITLYAKWTPITYKIHYNGNGYDGGTIMSDSVHTYNEEKNLSDNTYTKTGYTFAGWARSSTGTKEFDNKDSVFNLTTTNNATVNLYAIWTYNIVFDGNGATSGTMDNLIHQYNVPQNLTLNTYFIDVNTTFVGWTLSSDGSGTLYLDEAQIYNQLTPVDGTVTLYAKWEPVTP